MPVPNLLPLYVSDPAASQAFYERLLGRKPLGVFPTYVAFDFDGRLMLGLWSMQAKNFVSGGSGHRSELAFMVESEADVHRLHDEWRAAGVAIEQEPMNAVFGLTFVALDPDGHRLRVCLPDK
ncbi:VOC family protein [Bradyrhizobium sp. NP1]|uniref:VOC family protein n=1 Tax=Bradyrhizobium sp. NP1 TaxID=3049772 RepID=UPI0025A54687|nr:VOC family protein [Bradyrhizobium sp. NP1]WJR75353.1 VOC family protein [Bradyrhizobium sp. NP1]